MTAPVALERAVAPEKSAIVKPGIILKLYNPEASGPEESAVLRPGDTLKLSELEAKVGPKVKGFKFGGFYRCAKFVGDTACCIAEQVGRDYRVLNYFLLGSQDETCRAVTAPY